MKFPRVVQSKVQFAGWGTLTNHTVQMREGGELLSREVYDHGNAAAILLYARATRSVLLVRQLRVAALLQGDGDAQIEVCAGLLDGDAPEVCAAREAVEETGHAPRDIVHAFDAYMSPGSLTEKVHCFIAPYDDTTRVSAGGGLEAEGEEIEVLELEFDTAFAMIATGEIIDAKTIALLQHLKLSGILA